MISKFFYKYDVVLSGGIENHNKTIVVNDGTVNYKLHSNLKNIKRIIDPVKFKYGFIHPIILHDRSQQGDKSREMLFSFYVELNDPFLETMVKDGMLRSMSFSVGDYSIKNQSDKFIKLHKREFFNPFLKNLERTITLSEEEQQERLYFFNPRNPFRLMKKNDLLRHVKNMYENGTAINQIMVNLLDKNVISEKGYNIYKNDMSDELSLISYDEYRYFFSNFRASLILGECYSKNFFLEFKPFTHSGIRIATNELLRGRTYELSSVFLTPSELLNEKKEIEDDKAFKSWLVKTLNIQFQLVSLSIEAKISRKINSFVEDD